MNFSYNIVDSTHTLSPDIPTWGLNCGFRINNILDYKDCTTATKFRVQTLEMEAGIGTHLDAPAHCVEDARTIDQLGMHQMLAPCIF